MNIYIIFSLFLFISLKFIGLSYGLPFFLVSDEEVVVGSALRMLELKSFIPAFYPEEMKILTYPPMLPIIIIITISPIILYLFTIPSSFNVHILKILSYENIDLFFLAGRFGSVCINLITIFIVYKVCVKFLKSKSIAIIAVIFLITDFTFNLTSHFVRHWNLTTLFIWATIFYSINLFKSNESKNYYLASILSGVGFGISYVFGSFGYLIFNLVHFLKYKLKNIRCFFISIVLFITICFVNIISHPFALFRLIENKEGNVTALYENQYLLDTLFYFLKGLFFTNPVILFTSICTLFYLIFSKKMSKLHLLLVIFVFGFLITVHLTTKVEFRYVLPIIPALAIFSGIGINMLLKNKNKFTQLLILIFVFFYPFSSSAYMSFLLGKEDTRIMTLKWISSNLDNGIKIANGMKNINLDKKIYGNSNINYKNITKLKENYKIIDFSSKFNKKEDNENLYKKEIHKRNFDYVIINYVNSDKKFYRISKNFYKELSENFELYHKITPSLENASPPDLHSTKGFYFPVYNLLSFKRLGPSIEIFKAKASFK